MSATTAVDSYISAENHRIEAANGISFAYRDLGSGEVPLVLFQHFRGNLENWDPALIDALAQNRRVVTFDNTGVGGSTGQTPHTIAEMAHDAIAFLDALELAEVDLLGFSIGSFVAQEITLTRPGTGATRRSRFVGAPGRGRHARLGKGRDRRRRQRQDRPRAYCPCSTRPPPRARTPASSHCSESSVPARTTAMPKRHGRPGRRSTTPCARGECPNHALLQRVSAIDCPVFIANGDSDPMILPHYSYLLAGLIPQAKLKIYPDSAHGFLFQHATEFAADVEAFLSGSGPS